MITYLEYPTPLGPLLLTQEDGAVTGIDFCRTPPAGAVMARVPVLCQAQRWLDAYFSGTPQPVSFPLAPAGTPFQQQIWRLLLDIPYGATCTYGQLARQAALALGKLRMAAQAVGGAVGRNPIAIVIPCHRCIGAGGDLVGYAAGLERKAWLLAHEKGKIPPPEKI